MNNTKMQTPWGRILLMHRLLWSLYKTSLLIALGIAASIGGLIAVWSVTVASERELSEFSSWGWGPMIGIIICSMGVSWFWSTYCLNHSVHRMVGANFSTIPLRLREKCVAIGLYLLEGYVTFIAVGHLIALLMAFCLEGLGAFGMLADIYITPLSGFGALASEVIEEAGLNFLLAGCLSVGLIGLLDTVISIWAFICFGGYIKAFLLRMVASYVSMQLVWFFAVFVIDTLSPWKMIGVSSHHQHASPTNLWLMCIFLFALIAFALYRTLAYLRTTDR